MYLYQISVVNNDNNTPKCLAAVPGCHHDEAESVAMVFSPEWRLDSTISRKYRYRQVPRRMPSCKCLKTVTNHGFYTHKVTPTSNRYHHCGDQPPRKRP